MPSFLRNARRADELLERALHRTQRSIIGRIDILGIVGVAACVPLAFAAYASQRLLIGWSIAVVATSLGWSMSRSESSRLPDAAIWFQGAVWASLPWLLWSALDQEAVAWMLTCVAGYGLATDALLLPQTYRTNVAALMTSYTVPYLVALGAHGHFYPAAGLAALLIHLVAGVWGFERIKRGFLKNLSQTEAEAFRDPLTGLGSRGAVMREIERRLTPGADVHCVVLDVDDFKSINTLRGHHGGDAALFALARALEETLPSWFVGRLGGDEFAAINDRALRPAEEDRLTAIDIGDLTFAGQVLGLSLGASSVRGGRGSADTLLTEASAALQRAKQWGKQRLVVADDSMRAEELRRQDLADHAHHALIDGSILAWGQPIVDLRTNQRAGIELLARWQRATSLETPHDFVPVMEASGLAPQLAWRMLDHAIETLAALTASGDRDTFVSVNVSALVLLEPNLAERLAILLGDRRIAPTRLILEITGSQRLPNTKLASDAFGSLRHLGIGIASDNLGSGWSTIDQMIRHAFTHVKVDRELVSATGRPGGHQLISSIRTLAEGSDQVAIAEGIENAADLARVQEAGFVLGQGFLFARPAPITEILAQVTGPIQLDSTNVGSTEAASHELTEPPTGAESRRRRPRAAAG